MGSRGALEVDDVPGSLLVVGGGYIGLEMGTVYARLGADVTVVEMMDTLLPGTDPDLVRVLDKSTRGLFADVMLSTTVEELTARDDGVEVSFGGEDEPRTFDRVLVAVGRRPRSSGFGLSNTDATVDRDGFIEVDERMRTADAAILAVGDVAGQPMLAHKATHQGRVAAEVAAGMDSAFRPRCVPAVVFTDPEVAWTGLTEQEARSRGIEVRVTKFPWSASGRLATLGRDAGLTKLVVDPLTGRVLGAGLVGPGAGELVAEASIAIEMAAVVGDLASTIHPHPTLSETIMEAAELYSGPSTHYHRRRRS
jgi:dihydrolipoamide dehydrogenase